MITPGIWLRNKLLTSTTITQYTTQVYPDFLPLNKTPPAIIYKDIGSDRNITERNQIFSLSVYHDSKNETEILHESIYDLFDTSTSYIKETSSYLNIDSVNIITPVSGSGYDDENSYWFKVLDLSVWYH